MNIHEQFSFENVVKQFGEINQALYGVNPYKEKEYEGDRPEYEGKGEPDPKRDEDDRVLERD